MNNGTSIITINSIPHAAREKDRNAPTETTRRPRKRNGIIEMLPRNAP